VRHHSSTYAVTTKSQAIADQSPFVAKPTAIYVQTGNLASMSNKRHAHAILPCLALWLSGTAAFAQTNHSHHEYHADHYRHWQRPDAGGSCCNARTTKNGYEEGDCEPTKAEIRNGIWFAWLREQNRWVQIPDIRIINERNPSPEDAHLCWAYDSVLCFLPPHTGG
jgi:hypothetical protein